MRHPLSCRCVRAALVGILLWGFPGPATPQFGKPSPPPGLPNLGQPSTSSQAPPADPAEVIYTHHMVDYRIAMRFKKVQQDAVKLVELTAKLQQAMAKPPSGTSSADALHDAAQIEKLAKSVNENTRD
jgi:hypothetical protein